MTPGSGMVCCGLSQGNGAGRGAGGGSELLSWSML